MKNPKSNTATTTTTTSTFSFFSFASSFSSTSSFAPGSKYPQTRATYESNREERSKTYCTSGMKCRDVGTMGSGWKSEGIESCSRRRAGREEVACGCSNEHCSDRHCRRSMKTGEHPASDKAVAAAYVLPTLPLPVFLFCPICFARPTLRSHWFMLPTR